MLEKIIEHVYHPDNDETQFCHARITLRPSEDFGDEKLIIIIEPDKEMPRRDAQNVLRYLEKSVIKRMNLTLWMDCIVFVEYEDKKYSLELEGIVRVRKLNSI